MTLFEEYLPLADASIAVVPRGFVEQVLQGLEDLLEEVTLDETSLKHFVGFLGKTGKSENTTSIEFSSKRCPKGTLLTF